MKVEKAMEWLMPNSTNNQSIFQLIADFRRDEAKNSASPAQEATVGTY